MYNHFMPSVEDIQTARLLKSRLQAEIPLKRFVFYGSRARGDADEYADLDIYIELATPATTSLRRRIREIAWEVGLDADVIISTLIGGNNLAGQPILKNIEREGLAV